MGLRISSRTELEARVEIRQPKELEVFDSLRLSIVVTTKVLAEAIAVVLLVAVRY